MAAWHDIFQVTAWCLTEMVLKIIEPLVVVEGPRPAKCSRTYPVRILVTPFDQPLMADDPPALPPANDNRHRHRRCHRRQASSTSSPVQAALGGLLSVEEAPWVLVFARLGPQSTGASHVVLEPRSPPSVDPLPPCDSWIPSASIDGLVASVLSNVLLENKTGLENDAPPHADDPVGQSLVNVSSMNTSTPQVSYPVCIASDRNHTVGGGGTRLLSCRGSQLGRTAGVIL